MGRLLKTIIDASVIVGCGVGSGKFFFCTTHGERSIKGEKCSFVLCVCTVQIERNLISKVMIRGTVEFTA